MPVDHASPLSDPSSHLLIGVMSGTSLDGLDAVLVRFSDHAPLKVLGHQHTPFSPPLRDALLALNTPGDNELHRAALAANALADTTSTLIHALLEAQTVSIDAVRAAGVHGQTVRHQPQAGYTWQLNNPARIAEATGLTVVADLRARDVAAGGQGAPLAPGFHQAWLGGGADAIPTAVLNVGGFTNLSLLPFAEGQVLTGFDCGPGNVLMDAWIARHQGLPYDADGAWAASGQVHVGLLAALLATPFFHQPPPKSTGRDDFHLPWLDAHLASQAAISPADVQATLCELTAQTCAQALPAPWRALPQARLVVCGGGAFNGQLMRRLAAHLPGWQVESSGVHGLPPDQVEATAFAWLAWRCLQAQPGNAPSVTGARGPRVLGAIYPG